MGGWMGELFFLLVLRRAVYANCVSVWTMTKPLLLLRFSLPKNAAVAWKEALK